jgi:hypothetical protein
MCDVCVAYALHVTAVGTSLSSRLAGVNTLPIPTVAPAVDVPVLTTGAAGTITGGIFGAQQPGLVTEVGSRGVWNPASNRYTVSGFGDLPGLDFYLTGTTIEFELFNTGGAGTVPVWIWVNGAPITATPDTIVFASNSAFYKLVFSTSVQRHVEIFLAGGQSLNGWRPIRVDALTAVAPAPRKPVVLFVGDSFYMGSAGCPPLLSPPFLISRLLEIEAVDTSIGGTGYVAGGANIFGSPTRIALATSAVPNLIVVSGSVNDDANFATVGVAAAAAYAAYAAACPSARLIVFGPQPSNAIDTISTNRAAQNAAVRAAALAAPNVIAYYDQVGTASGVPAAWSGVTTYNPGDRVTYLGSVYKAVNTIAFSGGTPGNSTSWALQTFAYSGTGTSAVPTGDGTRDVFLYSDSVHPTIAASAAFAVRQAGLIRTALLAASR